MPCPICGSEYVIVGEQRVCPKDGHIAGYKQINIVELINEVERLKKKIDELEGYIERRGLNSCSYD